MDPLTIANLFIALLREALRAIEAGVLAKQISVEAQERLLAKIAALRDGRFDGPEWDVEADPPK